MILSFCFMFSLGLCSENDVSNSSASDLIDGEHSIVVPLQDFADLHPDGSNLVHQNDGHNLPVHEVERLIGVHEALHVSLKITPNRQKPDSNDEHVLKEHLSFLQTLSAQNGFRKDGRATWQARDLPGLIDDANRWGACFSQVSRNFLFMVSGVAEVVGLGLLTIAQMHDFDQETKDDLIVSGTIVTAAAPVIAGISHVFLKQTLDRITQLKIAADIYNVEILGLLPLYPDVSLKKPEV